MLESLCSWPCNGQMISFRHILIPTSIQVFNVGNIAKDNIELYFEHQKSSGGADIKEFTVNEQFGYAIIEFHDQQGKYFVFAECVMLFFFLSLLFMFCTCCK